MTKPVFSIVTITRNNLDGFRRTQESLDRQSFRNFEWLVIDGNSTDGTQSILPENALSEPDNGIYDAMNKGIHRSTGEYILFLNAGDTLSDADILATIARTIAIEKPDYIYGDALETGGWYKKARDHHRIELGMFTHHQAMLYKRDCLGGLRYDADYKIAGDYAFTRAFLEHVKTVSYIPAAICIFETGGISQRHMRLGRIEQYKARQKAGYHVFKNMSIYAMQTLTASFRAMFPRAYQSVRPKIRSFILSCFL